MEKKEKFFWADQIADSIIKEKKGKKIYVCASGITPSGTIHIGNFREVITTDLVVRVLKSKGKKVRFIYSWDDFDRFRKVPVNLPKEKQKEFESYIGINLSDIPSPFKKNESYAEHFEKEFENSLKKVGIKPNFIRQSVMNKKCKYAKLIRTAIDKKAVIIKILDKYRKEPLNKDWCPVNVYCEVCKKDSTKIVSSKDYIIEYECACGFKNRIDYRKKGIVKLKWRVDWPARWSYEEVSYEPGGIDHSVIGGSFMTAKEISKKVFNYNPPVYTFYEWVRLKGGREFSSSAGNVVTLDEVEEVYEPEILRYLFVSTRPNKNFHISFDSEIIKIYEEFDVLEKKYYEGKANPQEKRIYELSNLKVQKKLPEKTGFRHLITLVQAGKKTIKKQDVKRAEKVSRWIEKYAGDEFKFKVQEKINKDVSLSDKQKEALIELKKILEVKKLNKTDLFNEFYNICNSIGIKNNDFFQGAYNVILNKNRGPRLADLIFTVGREKIIKLLEQIK